jgi:uncharacterized protein YjiS (DUF1127 family)
MAALLGRWLKEIARARAHRRQAQVLAQLDRRMLADMGITRSDLADAFSEPFWEDPTALLRERALERRLNRHGISTGLAPRIGQPETGFRRPPTDRPARQAI